MKAIFAMAVFALLSGCVAQPYRPIVDNGTRIGDYDADLNLCKDVAAQVQPANAAGGGAVAGAVFGALLAGAVGLRGRDVGRVAAWGAASGGVQGLAVGSAEWQRVVDTCMARRGYNVLN